MKIVTTLAALTFGLAATGLVYADQPYYPMNDTVATSTLTRAQVVQQLREAQTRGLLAASGDQLDYPLIATKSTKSRAQVLFELRLAQANGEIQSGELPYYPDLPVSHTQPNLIARHVQ
ncbi:DUF4148 domain-containing protein [Alcaligenaceae bacterium CGII-47]|nr:DUF4148 domain-containing protein [Alcaligenaceae bacterium CGII-47]